MRHETPYSNYKRHNELYSTHSLRMVGPQGEDNPRIASLHLRLPALDNMPLILEMPYPKAPSLYLTSPPPPPKRKRKEKKRGCSI